MPKGSGQTAWIRHQIPRDRIWRLCDARGQVLGRIATQIATILMGKNKPTYLDNIFSGDPVVVINATQFALTGRKWETKRIVSHTGTPGGLKRRPVRAVLATRPTHPLYLAVKRMLPANRLRTVRLANLHLFPGDEHPHESQAPVLLPPAHVGARLGRGGPPERADLENWWLDQVCEAPDRVLEPIVAEARAEAPKSRGLLELLQGGGDGDGPGGSAPVGSGRHQEVLETYVREAENLKRSMPAYPAVVPA